MRDSGKEKDASFDVWWRRGLAKTLQYFEEYVRADRVAN